MHVFWFTNVDETLRAGPLRGCAEPGHARAQARPSPVEPETQVTVVAAPEVTGVRQESVCLCSGSGRRRPLPAKVGRFYERDATEPGLRRVH